MEKTLLPTETNALIMSQEAHYRVMSNFLRNYVNRSIALRRISEFKQPNALNPWLGRSNMQPSVKKKSSYFLPYLDQVVSRGRMVDVSDYKALMTPGDWDSRHGIGPRQPVWSSVDDVVARREKELRIELEVCHCGRRRRSGRRCLGGSSRMRRR